MKLYAPSTIREIKDKYGFRLKDCQWMTTETLQVYRYENGKEVV